MVQKQKDYEDDDGYEYEEEENGKGSTGSAIVEARWFVVCLAVVVPLWVSPFEFTDAFVGLSVSLLKVVGWLIGIAAIIFAGSIGLSALGDILLKGTDQPNEDRSNPTAQGQA